MSSERRYPPFTGVGMASLALIVIGGIYLSAHLPRHVSLGPAIALLVGSIALLILNVMSLRRVENFAWPRFFYVAKRSLVAYLIIAGLIEYAFLQDNVHGGALIVLTLSLLVFAVQVPTLIAFTVARYDTPGSEPDFTALRLESAPRRP
jgi:hypothetical protein